MYSGTPTSPDLPPENGAELRRLSDLRATSSALRPSRLGLPPRTPPQALAGPLNLQALLRGLRRHLWIALGLGLLLAVPAALGAWLMVKPARFSARSLLQVAATEPAVFKGIDAGDDTRADFANYQKTQEVLIKSRRVLGTALRNPDVANLPLVVRKEDPVAWLAETLALGFTGEVLSIELKGDRGDEVVALVNAVTDAYLNEIVNDEKNKRLRVLANLQEFADKYREDLQARKENLKSLAQAVGSNDEETLAIKHQLAIERLSAAEQELRQLKARLRDARMELSLLEESPAPAANSAPAVGVEAAVAAALQQDETLRQHQEQVTQLHSQYAQAYRLTGNGYDPAVQHAHKALESARRAMESYQGRLRQTLTSQSLDAQRRGTVGQGAPGPGTAGAQQANRALLARQIEVLGTYETEKAHEVATLEAGLKDFNLTTLDLEALRDDIRQAEQIDAQMSQKIEEEKANVAAPDRIKLIEKAEVAQSQSEKKRYMASGVAGMGTFGMVLLGVAWLDARLRRVHAVDEVVQGLGMSLVGTLPSLTERPRRALAGPRGEDRAWDDLLLESVNATRAMLLHSLEAESVQVLMVASAQKGEGKTSLACHLATSLARARRRTLLIDCDLRSPAVHVLFDHPRGPGLSEVLRGEAELDDAIQPTAAAGLSLITAGHCDAAAVDSLAQGNLHEFLGRLRQRYDYIIVDSAPILAVSDSLHICQHADAALFSVLREVSRLPKIQAAYERITRLGVRFLGAVIAGTRVDDYYDSYAYSNSAPTAGADPAAPVS